ncbi:hypothetical protein B0J14DRAFT_232564 [Halenospora varia]|nr:hypothetical protein B0J14DRAFT_232564 [Halenospora varia]
MFSLSPMPLFLSCCMRVSSRAMAGVGALGSRIMEATNHARVWIQCRCHRKPIYNLCLIGTITLAIQITGISIKNGFWPPKLASTRQLCRSTTDKMATVLPKNATRDSMKIRYDSVSQETYALRPDVPVHVPVKKRTPLPTERPKRAPLLSSVPEPAAEKKPKERSKNYKPSNARKEYGCRQILVTEAEMHLIRDHFALRQQNRRLTAWDNKPPGTKKGVRLTLPELGRLNKVRKAAGKESPGKTCKFSKEQQAKGCAVQQGTLDRQLAKINIRVVLVGHVLRYADLIQ